MGLALGYEDLNDHDALRHDPLLALLSDVADPTGHDRRRAQDKGCALAGKSTLNRLELTPLDADAASRYKKIVTCPKVHLCQFSPERLKPHITIGFRRAL